MGTELKSLIKVAEVDTNFPFKEIITDHVFDLSEASQNGEVFYTINWGYNSTTENNPFIAPSEKLEKAITLVINQLNNTIATPFVKATGDQIPLVSFNFISKSNLISNIDSVTAKNFETLVTKKNNTYVIRPEDGLESTDTTLVGNYKAPGNMYFVQYPSSAEETYNNAAEATKTALGLNDVLNGKMSNQIQDDVQEILIVGAKTSIGDEESPYQTLISDITTWYGSNSDVTISKNETSTTSTNEELINSYLSDDELAFAFAFNKYTTSEDYSQKNITQQFTVLIFDFIKKQIVNEFKDKLDTDTVNLINNYITQYEYLTSNTTNSSLTGDVESFYSNLIGVLRKIVIFIGSYNSTSDIPKPSNLPNKESAEYLMYVHNYQLLLNLKDLTKNDYNNDKENFNKDPIVSKIHDLIKTILDDIQLKYTSINTVDIDLSIDNAKQAIYSYVKNQTYIAFNDITFNNTNVFNLWRDVYIAGIKGANKIIQTSLLSYYSNNASEIANGKGENKTSTIENKVKNSIHRNINILKTMGFTDNSIKYDYDNNGKIISIKDEIDKIKGTAEDNDKGFIHTDQFSQLDWFLKEYMITLIYCYEYLEHLKTNTKDTFTVPYYHNDINSLSSNLFTPSLINYYLYNQQYTINHSMNVLSNRILVFLTENKANDDIINTIRNIFTATSAFIDYYSVILKNSISQNAAIYITETIKETIIHEDEDENKDNITSFVNNINFTSDISSIFESDDYIITHFNNATKTIWDSASNAMKDYYTIKNTPGSINIHPNYSSVGTYRFSTLYYALNKALGLKGLSTEDVFDLIIAGKQYYDFPFTAMEDQILVQGFKKANIYSNNYFNSFAPLDVYALQEIYGSSSDEGEKITDNSVIPHNGFTTYSGKNTETPLFIINIPYMSRDSDDRTGNDIQREVVYQKIKINETESAYDFYYVQLKTDVINGTEIKSSSYIGAFIVNANTQIENAFHGITLGNYYKEIDYIGNAIYEKAPKIDETVIPNSINWKTLTTKNIKNVQYPAATNATSKITSENMNVAFSGEMSLSYGDSSGVQDTSTSEGDVYFSSTGTTDNGISLRASVDMNGGYVAEQNASQSQEVKISSDNNETLQMSINAQNGRDYMINANSSAVRDASVSGGAGNDAITGALGHIYIEGAFDQNMYAVTETDYIAAENIDDITSNVVMLGSGTSLLTEDDYNKLSDNGEDVSVALDYIGDASSSMGQGTSISYAMGGFTFGLDSTPNAQVDDNSVGESFTATYNYDNGWSISASSTEDDISVSYAVSDAETQDVANLWNFTYAGGGATTIYAIYNDGGSGLSLTVGFSLKPNMNTTQTTLNIINATAIKLNGEDVDLQQQKASYAYGTIRLRDTDWTTITYKDNAKFDNPVLILGDPTYKDTQYVIPKVRNVGPSTFEARFVPASNDPVDTHKPEVIPYIVAEKGSTITIGSMKLHFNTFETLKVARNNDSTFETIDISSLAFAETPTLLTQIQTDNHKHNNKSVCMNMRAKSIDTEKFQVALQPEELLLDTLEAVSETVGYLVVTTGSDTSSSGTQVVANTFTNQNFNPAILPFPSPLQRIPITITKISSYKDSNPCNYRIVSNSNIGICGLIQEDKSKDAETVHTRDDMSYIAFA